MSDKGASDVEAGDTGARDAGASDVGARDVGASNEGASDVGASNVEASGKASVKNVSLAPWLHLTGVGEPGDSPRTPFHTRGVGITRWHRTGKETMIILRMLVEQL